MSRASSLPEYEDAFAYIANVLNDNERQAFEDALDRSSNLRQQVTQLQALAADLLASAPVVAPTADLKGRVMAAIDQPGPSLTRAQSHDWIPAGPEGVETRTLRKDLKTRREMLLLRMRPGAIYPLHSHPGAEDCYVISGDLQDGSIDLQAGDFIRFPTGTAHGPIRSRSGCVLLLDIAIQDHHPPA